MNKAIKSKQFLNPFGPFSLVGLSLFLYNPSWSPYTPTLDSYATLLIILGVLSSYFGLIFAEKTSLKSKYSGGKKSFYSLFLVLILVCLGILPYIMGVQAGGMVFDASSADEVLEVKEAFTKQTFITQLANFLPVSFLIAAQRKKTIFFWILSALAVFCSLLVVTKTAFVLVLVFIAIALIYFPNVRNISFLRNKYWIYISFVASFLFIMSYNSSIRGGDEDYKKNVLFAGNYSSTFFDKLPLSSSLYFSYCYFCTSWSNFSYVVEQNRPLTYGQYTFQYFSDKLGIKLYDKKVKRMYRIHPFNTYSYLCDYFMDFGLVGVLICPFLLSVVLYTVYIKVIESLDPLLLGIYGLLFYAMVMMAFSNHFSYGYIWTFILFTFIIKTINQVINKIF